MGIESDKQQKRPIRGQMTGTAWGEGTERYIGVQVDHFTGVSTNSYPLFLVSSGLKSEGNLLEFGSDITAVVRGKELWLVFLGTLI